MIIVLHFMRMTVRSAWILGLALLLILVTSAYAHAYLDHAQPRVRAQIQTAPSEVKIWFSQELEPAFSSIQVFAPDGTEVDKKDTHLDANDKTLLIVSLPSIPPGTYKVIWHVVSTDTHKTQGDYKFTLK